MEKREQEKPECPFLTPVMVDSLWMYPTALFCQIPLGRVRIPGAATLAAVCLNGQYRDRCEVYREWRAQELLGN